MDPSFFLSLGVFAVALAGLLFMADRFVSSTEEIGLALGIPSFIMGITVLAVGTSLPELITALFALHEGTSQIVIGTVVGSNVANVLLIIGVTAIFARNMVITWDLLHGDLPMLFGSLLLLAFVVYPISNADFALFHEMNASVEAGNAADAGRRSLVTWLEGALLLGGYLLYLYYYAVRSQDEEITKNQPVFGDDAPGLRVRSIVWVIVGAVGVFVGARYTVTSAIEMAAYLGLGEEVVAASMIALGTSMPEMVVALSAARRKNFEMAIGNVTGSNIFNTFVVLGAPAVLAPLMGDGQGVRVGENSVLYLQLPFYAASLMLFLVIVMDKTLTRTEGIMILVAYLLFIAKLFSLL